MNVMTPYQENKQPTSLLSVACRPICRNIFMESQ